MIHDPKNGFHDPRIGSVSVATDSIEETIIDALLTWARSGNQAPRSIGLAPALFRRLEGTLRDRLMSLRALSDNESIVIHGPGGPVRIFKEE